VEPIGQCNAVTLRLEKDGLRCCKFKY
jgi:hypothetical protein